MRGVENKDVTRNMRQKDDVLDQVEWVGGRLTVAAAISEVSVMSFAVRANISISGHAGKGSCYHRPPD